jgi:lipoprotein-releasing system ATP-binding protein
MSNILEVKDVRRIFNETGEKLEVLKGVDLQLSQGEILAILGSSGSGKSTLLNVIGSLDEPTSGEVFFKGKEIFSQGSAYLNEFRAKHIGFVFQFHHLLPELTALENVMLPSQIIGKSEKEAKKQASELLETVGLSSRMEHLPNELSGGERQRAAVARALINRPEIVLADEPSGNLDEGNSQQLHQIIAELNREFNQTFILVTHDLDLAEVSNRKLWMTRGHLSESP